MNIEDCQKLICELAGTKGNSRPPSMLYRLEQYLNEVRLFPDQINLLRAICSAIDHEPDYDLAWQKVFDIRQATKLHQANEHKHVSVAVCKNISDSTIAYIDLGTAKVSTGVLVAITDRTFIATCAHSVKDPTRIAFVGATSTDIQDCANKVLNWRKDSNYIERDVAYLELDPNFVTSHIAKKPIQLSRIMPCGPGISEHWAVVAGYPSEYVSNSADERVFTMECWGNSLLPTQEWHVLEARDTDAGRRAANLQLDIFIPRPIHEDVIQVRDLETVVASKLVEPFGMSGGGYWQLNRKAHEIWTAESYSLIGIQSHWWKRGRYLQATQIIHWLRLLWKHEPQLRTHLRAAFPSEFEKRKKS